MEVKGASVMCLHKHFDLSKGFCVDALHLVFLGVTLDLLSLWFGEAHQRKQFSIRSEVILMMHVTL